MKRKVIAIGDSFAEFPPHNNHWVQQVLPDSESISLPGGDIATTSFMATKVALEETHTHIIFFVTSFNRHSVQVNKRSKADLLGDIIHNETRTPDSYYHNFELPNGVDRVENDTKYRYLSGSWGEWASGKDVYSEEITTHLQYLPDYQFLHNRLGNLALLQNVCSLRGINLLYVTPFSLKTNVRVCLNMIQSFDERTPVFDYLDYLDDPDNAYRINCTSHHTVATHTEIANIFRKSQSAFLFYDK